MALQEESEQFDEAHVTLSNSLATDKQAPESSVNPNFLYHCTDMLAVSRPRDPF